ncbi:MAG: glycosyl hydrolase 2 galactose-binding domain-containing protein, partial [Planctomycetota bacterium]
DADLAGREALFLECDGLETVGRARLGRKVLGRFENGLRPHRFDLSGTRAGEHALSFEFEPLFGVLAARNRTFALPGWGVGVDKDDTAAWVRTAPVHMGWDFAPKAVPVGVTGPVRLVGFDRARIDGVRIAQDVTRARATLKVTVELERVSPGAVQVEGLVAIDGEVCATAQMRTRGAKAVLEFVVRRPRLWWPNTYGEQPLYTLSLVLRSEGALLDACQHRLGLRKVELLRKPDRDGEGFAFAVNGRRIDVRGANWVPPEPVPGIGDPEGRTADLLGCGCGAEGRSRPTTSTTTATRSACSCGRTSRSPARPTRPSTATGWSRSRPRHVTTSGGCGTTRRSRCGAGTTRSRTVSRGPSGPTNAWRGRTTARSSTGCSRTWCGSRTG